jgi:nicotinic acid mononucleotide adenylyltransferase
VPRPGADIELAHREQIRVLDPAIVFDDAEEMTISATEVRRRVRAGSDISGLVPPAVADAVEGYTSAG